MENKRGEGGEVRGSREGEKSKHCASYFFPSASYFFGVR